MTPSLSALLEAHDWQATIVKLTAYAVSLCLYRKVPLPGGQEPEDLAMEAIDRVFRQERCWDPEKHPDLMNYLKSVVKSLLSNELTSAEGSTHHESVDKAAGILSEAPTREEELYYEELDQHILIRLRGDPLLCLVYKALKDGYKPGEISEEYGLDIQNVRNAQKRLHRAVVGISGEENSKTAL
jgi:DNA-directed RNA polymerase specialized sigma24 family protein